MSRPARPVAAPEFHAGAAAALTGRTATAERLLNRVVALDPGAGRSHDLAVEAAALLRLDPAARRARILAAMGRTRAHLRLPPVP
ncbi:hypothetical protein [Dactylosporangium sp. NPDC049140]|uniref:hypothetical protein n=1 Tax=Dactylosporangium sp. NPDC049140 TaxID=3155647 RepID=UPI0034090C45